MRAFAPASVNAWYELWLLNWWWRCACWRRYMKKQPPASAVSPSPTPSPTPLLPPPLELGVGGLGVGGSVAQLQFKARYHVIVQQQDPLPLCEDHWAFPLQRFWQ